MNKNVRSYCSRLILYVDVNLKVTIRSERVQLSGPWCFNECSRRTRDGLQHLGPYYAFSTLLNVWTFERTNHVDGTRNKIIGTVAWSRLRPRHSLFTFYFTHPSTYNLTRNIKSSFIWLYVAKENSEYLVSFTFNRKKDLYVILTKLWKVYFVSLVRYNVASFQIFRLFLLHFSKSYFNFYPFHTRRVS